MDATLVEESKKEKTGKGEKWLETPMGSTMYLQGEKRDTTTRLEITPMSHIP